MNIPKAPIILFALLLTCFTCGYGQEISQSDSVKVTTNLITMNVIVTDGQGRYVTGLTQEQFAIYDENGKQKIAHFSVGDAPLSIGIICEIHPDSPKQVEAVLAGIRQFVLTLRDRDRFFFTAYSADGSVTVEFVPSAKQIIDHLQAVKPRGPSSLYDVVYAASDRLRNSRSLKRALLIISDGNDNQSNCTYDEMRNRLREFDAQIYTISLAGLVIDDPLGRRHWMFEDFTKQTGRRLFDFTSEEEVGRAVLAEMSRVSGGSTFSPESENEPELVAICTQIALELRQQYTLGFYPTETTTGKWHRLKVRLEAPTLDFSLSYRSGYQIPAQTEYINF